MPWFSVERLKPLVTRWLPVDESVEGVGKAVGFFSLPVEGVEKSRWEIFSQTVGNVGKSRLVFFPYPLKALRKAVGKSHWENSSYPLKIPSRTVNSPTVFTVRIRSLQPVKCDLSNKNIQG